MLTREQLLEKYYGKVSEGDELPLREKVTAMLRNCMKNNSAIAGEIFDLMYELYVLNTIVKREGCDKEDFLTYYLPIKSPNQLKFTLYHVQTLGETCVSLTLDEDPDDTLLPETIVEDVLSPYYNLTTDEVDGVMEATWEFFPSDSSVQLDDPNHPRNLIIKGVKQLLEGRVEEDTIED